MKTKLTVIATVITAFSISSVFAVGNQEVNIANQLVTSNHKIPILFLPVQITSKNPYGETGIISCTLNGSEQDLCVGLQPGDGSVNIPFGRTLTITVYPAPLATPGSKTIFPGFLQWAVGYTQGPCDIESPVMSTNPYDGHHTPPNIYTTVNSPNYFEGGSSFCKHTQH